MGKIISIIIGIMFIAGTLVSCAPKKVTQIKITPVQFEQTPHIQNQLDTIPDPGKPKALFIDENGEITTDSAKAIYVAFSKADYPKVVANLKLKETYKDMYLANVEVTNQYIDTLNGLKELINQDQQFIQLLNERQSYFENQYRQEVYDHKIDNFYHRTIIGLMGVGAIVIAILAL